jgi:outer membrane protein assembly factor BamB
MDTGHIEWIERAPQTVPRFCWPGVPPNDFVSTEHSSSEDAPWVLQDPIDVDQDGQGDIIIANPNQAWVMAISGVGKGILWFVGRGEDLKQAAPSSPFRRPSASSAVLYEPLLIDDIDGDGVQDILLTFADLKTQPLPQSGRFDCKRWIEVISGSTGNMLWDYQLSNNLFELNTTEEVPDFFRWFPHRDSNRHQRVGTRFSFGSVLYRSPDSAKFSGAHVYQPDRPARVQMGDQWAIALVAGKQLIVIDPKSGKDLLEPVELGSRPGNAVKWADTNGDQLEEMIFLEEIQYLPYGNEPTPKLIVWSLSEQSEQWSMLLDAYWPSRRTWAGGTPDWPIVEDVDRDGAVEIIVPYRRSHRSNSFTGGPLIRSTPIGELAVLEGRSGKIRWSKRFVTIDSEVAYFAAGPDIDGDDCAEIFVTTLVSEHATSGPRMKLFVDAVSGANGKTLWTSSHDLFDDDSGLASHQLSTPSWWNNGHDGWPQLLVKITNRRGPVKSRFFCISAATGTQSHVGDQIQSLTPMDMDHDGVEDLLVLGSPQETNSGGKSLLHCIRGVGRQMWRRIGDLGDPIADLDGDSVDDLVLSFGDGTIIATNGKNGQPLWRNRPVAATSKLEIRSALSATSSDSGMKRIDSSSKDHGKAAT